MVASCATLFSENDIQLTFWQHCSIQTIICLYVKCNFLTKAVTPSSYTHMAVVGHGQNYFYSICHNISPPNYGGASRIWVQKKDFLNRLKSFHLLREPHTPTLSVRRVFLLTIPLYKCVNCVSANRAILSGRLQTLCSKSQSQIACYTLYLNAKAVIKLRDKASFYIATQKLACFLITVNKLSLHGGLRS